MNPKNLLNLIDSATQGVRTSWPLYSFVTSNPLAGHEKTDFLEAVIRAKGLTGGDLLPNPEILRKAFDQGDIEKETLSRLLTENGCSQPLAETLDAISSNRKYHPNENADLDRVMCKYMMAFMDEGLAEWEMPFKTKGFYSAWRRLALYDKATGCTSIAAIPQSALEAIAKVLSAYQEAEHEQIIQYHLHALPGWVGYIKFRKENNSPWQQHYPIDIKDYLAVRLWIASQTGARIKPLGNDLALIRTEYKIRYAWLQAWENSLQDSLISKLSPQSNRINGQKTLADAQMVFCIDTRSELIRRHIEDSGNYETFGYAGFFGIAMNYMNPTTGIISKSCPPILPSSYMVTEVPTREGIDNFSTYQKNNKRSLFKKYFLKRMKNLLPSAFGFVETSGVAYGILLIFRSLFTGLSLQNREKANQLEKCCTPSLVPTAEPEGPENLSLEEKSAIVKTAFDLMGWKAFSPLVVFIGHASHSSNNPFASSLDCGACAASPGRHNARMLAKLANLPEIRSYLQQKHNISIPNSTQFIAGEHNTTTDEITLFDASLPEAYTKQVVRLKADLEAARITAIRERIDEGAKSSSSALRKVKDWSETRPEWGLAKNAAFIIGPRSLTKHINLNSQCFLHSYNWECDIDAEALQAIMQGPMVVTQWINSHYYFATVDNEKFGGGNKITHNIAGKFGVLQGNGGDLKSGLPLQSVNISDHEIYHTPLRLSVIIQAPTGSVKKVLDKNDHLKKLINNEWINLLIMDPVKHNTIIRYQKNNSETEKTLHSVHV